MTVAQTGRVMRGQSVPGTLLSRASSDRALEGWGTPIAPHGRGLAHLARETVRNRTHGAGSWPSPSEGEQRAQRVPR